MNEWLSLVPGFNIYALKGAGAMRSTLASSEPSHNRDSCHSNTSKIIPHSFHINLQITKIVSIFENYPEFI